MLFGLHQPSALQLLASFLYKIYYFIGHLLQMIKIRNSEEYGKVPKYICKRKQNLEKEPKECTTNLAGEQKGVGDAIYLVDQETRQKLLDVSNFVNIM